MMRLFILLVVVAGVLFFAFGDRNGAALRNLTAPSVAIGELLKSANEYDGRVVKTSGVVSATIGVLGSGGYQIRDTSDGAEIAVIAMGGIPAVGTTTTVTGKFKQAFVVGSFQYAVIVQDF